MTARATALAVPEPARGQLSAQIEASIGTTLFQRHQTGYFRSKEGRELIWHAELVEGSIMALERGGRGRPWRVPPTSPRLSRGCLNLRRTTPPTHRHQRRGAQDSHLAQIARQRGVEGAVGFGEEFDGERGQRGCLVEAESGEAGFDEGLDAGPEGVNVQP